MGNTLESLPKLAVEAHCKGYTVIPEAVECYVLSLIFSPAHFDPGWKQPISILCEVQSSSRLQRTKYQGPNLQKMRAFLPLNLTLSWYPASFQYSAENHRINLVTSTEASPSHRKLSNLSQTRTSFQCNWTKSMLSYPTHTRGTHSSKRLYLFRIFSLHDSYFIITITL